MINIEITKILGAPGVNSNELVLGRSLDLTIVDKLYSNELPIIIEGIAVVDPFYKGYFDSIILDISDSEVFEEAKIIKVEQENTSLKATWRLNYSPSIYDEDISVKAKASGYFALSDNYPYPDYYNPRENDTRSLEEYPYNEQEYQVSITKPDWTETPIEYIESEDSNKVSFNLKSSLQALDERVYPIADSNQSQEPFVILYSKSDPNEKYKGVERLEGLCFDVSDVYRTSSGILGEVSLSYLTNISVGLGSNPDEGGTPFPIKLKKNELRGCLLEIKDTEISSKKCQGFYAILGHPAIQTVYGDVKPDGSIEQENFGIEMLIMPLCFTQDYTDANIGYVPIRYNHTTQADYEGNLENVALLQKPEFGNSYNANIYRTGSGIHSVTIKAIQKVDENAKEYNLVAKEGRSGNTDNVPLATYKDQFSVRLTLDDTIAQIYPNISGVRDDSNLVIRKNELRGMYLYSQSQQTWFKINSNAQIIKDDNVSTNEVGNINVTPHNTYEGYVSILARSIHKFHTVWDTTQVDDGEYDIQVSVIDNAGIQKILTNTINVYNIFSNVEFSNKPGSVRDSIIDIMDLPDITKYNQEIWIDDFMRKQ